MTSRSDASPDKPDTMVEADVANGESPDTEADAVARSGDEKGHAKHPTGEKQAAENVENDPPA